MSTHNLCFEQIYEKLQIFLFENFQFLEVKFSFCLNRPVFVVVLHLFIQCFFFFFFFFLFLFFGFFFFFVSSVSFLVVVMVLMETSGMLSADTQWLLYARL